MEELFNFNAPKLYQKLALPENEFEDWIIDLGLLPKNKTCECGGTMKHKWVPGRSYPAWRCTTKICRKEVGYLNGSWFEGARLSLKEIFQLSYFFCRQTHTYDEIIFDMQREGSNISSATINEWMQFYRNHERYVGGLQPYRPTARTV